MIQGGVTMDDSVVWYQNMQIQRVIKNLNKNNMAGYYVKDEKELIQKLRELVPEGTMVGVGDSMTLFEAGVIDFLRKGDFEFLDKYKEGITKDEKTQIYIENFLADTFICSTNALTEEGELYNIDGNGSRLAPIIYGSKQVILVAGINKIVKDIGEAERRVRQYAAPIDAKRLGKNTPCVKLGYCVDCKSDERICNTFVAVKRQFIKDRIKVIIVAKSLGY
jgi:hypothetical protein